MPVAPAPNPSASVMNLLAHWGPDALEAAPDMTESQALDYCRGLATSHYENFSVLTRLVPPSLRDDFAAVYAFCRWSDDLGDETGHDDAARERSLALLAWWRRLLYQCAASAADPAAPVPRHPVFVALTPTLRRHAQSGLSAKPFDDLIRAFEQDQTMRRYQTWDQLTDYCTRSADPVGRIVLMLAGYAPPEVAPQNAERYRLSDLTCTALQLINFWQDVRRDLVERDRVYIPAETGVTAELLRDWMDRGSTERGSARCDPAARVAFIHALRPLVLQTEAMFHDARALPGLLDSSIAPVVGLFHAGGEAILMAVLAGGCTTLWDRPRLGKATKAWLLLQAMARSRWGRR